jgi:uncharacterized protein involved in exopolysaccharide biosynthesis
MGEKEKESAQKVKKILSSKDVEELLKKSEAVLSEESAPAPKQLKTAAESKETIERLKRKRQRLEQAL